MASTEDGMSRGKQKSIPSPHNGKDMHGASLHVDYRPSSSYKQSPENHRHLGDLIHNHDNEIVWDDKLPQDPLEYPLVA